MLFRKKTKQNKNSFQAPVAQIDLNPFTQDDCCLCLNKEDNLSPINFSFCTGSIKIKLYCVNEQWGSNSVQSSAYRTVFTGTNTAVLNQVMSNRGNAK